MVYRVLTPLDLSAEERAELESWARRRKTAQGLALRARIVLLAADGLSKPFRWVKSADAILASVKRFCLKTLEPNPDNTTLSQTSGAGH